MKQQVHPLTLISNNITPNLGTPEIRNSGIVKVFEMFENVFEKVLEKVCDVFETRPKESVAHDVPRPRSW